MIYLKRLVGLKEEEYDSWKPLKRTIWRLLDCALCSGFWIGFILTFNPLIASAVSVVAELIDKKIKE